MHDDQRRIGLWIDTTEQFARMSMNASNHLFAPGLFCLGMSARAVGGRIHAKVYISRRESWDIRAQNTDGSIVSVSRGYVPQGLMPTKFYRRLHKPWRRIARKAASG